MTDNFHKEVSDFFSEQGELSKASLSGRQEFEYRPQQQEMALAVAHALSTGNNLCVEAPTGVGKSLAYLLPAILHSLSTGKPVLITTETIHLQEQLVNKDIPLLKRLLSQKFIASIAKGRANYVCQRRLELAVQGLSSYILPNTAIADIIEKLCSWIKHTNEGTISEIDFPVGQNVWDSVCCEHGNCLNVKCKFFKRCFYWSARRKWDKSNIIIANHALFFIDLALKNNEDSEGALLPEYCAVIFDEAHSMEESAAKHLGFQLSESGMNYFIRRLFNPEKGSGLFIRQGEVFAELRQLVTKLHDNSTVFFNNLRQVLFTKCRPSEEISYAEDTSGEKKFIKRYELRITQPDCVTDNITPLLAELESAINNAKKFLSQTEQEENLKTELTAQANKCRSLQQEIYDFITLGHEDFVYWLEMSQAKNNPEIHAAPVKIDELLQKILFNKKFPVILTSATLSVGNRLAYFTERIGFQEGDKITLSSPFDYKKQIEFFIPGRIPLPSDEEWIDTLPEYVKKFISMTNGRAFVLFTGYKPLFRCADALRDFFFENNIKLLVQKDNTKRSDMLKEFREDINSVIFGTSSFWTGVDVPGEALSNVIITKLPFHVPSHPLIAARHEVMEQKGKNPFMHYTLPEAVIKLRQGVGRLIRSKKDKGIIAILDKRIIVKSYGRYFLNSLPIDYTLL